MKKNLVSAKNWYVRNERRILITAAAVATGAAVVMKSSVNQHNQFLKEHDLFDTYYNFGEED